MSLKILPKKEIRSYELTLLLPADLASDEMEVVRGELRELLKKNKVSIVEEAEWGRKYLAYTIKYLGVRHTEANYLHWTLSAAPKQILKLEFELHNYPRVIRHLMVVAEAKKEAVKAAE
ncbi:MAG: 30S ribosomal protein S6 [Candidatus Pacebacteria bacterium]|nr:30S ribosomal protein S6 [Candidatus Paceibacterota bacterium]PIR59780.1 MAG: 30S ribosomal protein S6 [Candidatus Pacebacteria bacterium CG10_big_fil_rev_8_21_14_0_10_45_6]